MLMEINKYQKKRILKGINEFQPKSKKLGISIIPQMNKFIVYDLESKMIIFTRARFYNKTFVFETYVNKDYFVDMLMEIESEYIYFYSDKQRLYIFYDIIYKE